MQGTVPETLWKEIDSRLGRQGRGAGEACRLFHGRGRSVAGLEFVNIDWFAPVVLVTLYSDEGDEWLAALSERLLARLDARLSCLLVQRRYLPDSPSEILYGEIPDPAFAVENGLRYRLRLGSAQNIGFFPDMRQGRALARSLARGRKVLNLFAYTCSFSVAALSGGAEHVVNLDMNRGALALGRENHRDNGQDLRRASFLAHDLFKSFGKLKKLGPFALIVIDPPTEQGQSFSARRDWVKIISRLESLAAPGADILACLNAPQLGPEYLTEQFSKHLPAATLLEVLGSPDDFPEREAERGLNILHFRMKGEMQERSE